MTVNKLSQAKKELIGKKYTGEFAPGVKNPPMRIKDIAFEMMVSERTVARVLDELGLERPQANRKPALNYSVVMQYLMNLPEAQWQVMLTEVVKARIAKSYNVHTHTAMLQIEKKVEKNARDDARKRK